MNTEGAARSNYFRVKDVEAFKNWCSTLSSGSVTVVEQDDRKDALASTLEEHFEGKVRRVAVICDSGDVPCFKQECNSEGEIGEEKDIDFFDELKGHLVDEVAVFIGVSYEGHRYVGGWSYAVNAAGKNVSVNLSDIYEQAKALGTVATEAYY